MKHFAMTVCLFFAAHANYAAVAQAKDSIRISAVGDIMMGTTYPNNALPGNDGLDIFREAMPYIQDADIRFGNFEGTFFEGEPQQDGKVGGKNRWLFRTPLRYVDRLKDAGFNVMSLANNHVKDFGAAGVSSTKKVLTESEIKFSSKSGEVAQFIFDDIEVTLIALDYYPGCRSMTFPTKTYEEIKKLKANKQIVIVSVHAGGEGAKCQVIPPGDEIFLGENRGDSTGFARTAVDAGADLIIMHGPHVPRGLELYKRRLIAYSLGNFMTGAGVSISGVAGQAPLLTVELNANGEFKTGRIVSFRQLRNPQRVALDAESAALFNMRRLSLNQFPHSPLAIDEDGTLGIRAEEILDAPLP